MHLKPLPTRFPRSLSKKKKPLKLDLKTSSSDGQAVPPTGWGLAGIDRNSINPINPFKRSKSVQFDKSDKSDKSVESVKSDQKIEKCAIR